MTSSGVWLAEIARVDSEARMIQHSGDMIIKLCEAVQALEKRVAELERERRSNILANLHAATKEQG